MSHRITWRSRPRSEYPWPLKTGAKTLAELGIGAENPYDSLIGPLPMKAVVEILYRVAQLDFSLSITADPGGGDVTQTSSGSIRLQNSGSDPTEIEVFKRHSTYMDNDPGGLFGETGPSFTFENVEATETAYLQPIDMVWGGSAAEPAIFKDENGDFWLQGGFAFSTVFTDPITFDAHNLPLTVGGWILIDAQLVLSCGAFPIKCGVEGAVVSAASLTIEATEWWPYKTTAGADAWNTTTGAPANGGPGA